MDYVSRQFINLTKKFRKEFRLLLNKWVSTLEKQTKAIRECTEAKDGQQYPPPVVNVTVQNNLPESVNVKQHTDDARSEKNYRLATIFLTSVNLALFFIYATLVFRQYQQSILTTIAAQNAATAALEAIKTSKDQFRMDQQPYVWDVSIESSFYNDKIGAVIELANFGKSPALATRGTGHIFMGVDALNKATTWFGQFDKRRLGPKDSAPTIIPPGIPPQPGIQLIRGYIHVTMETDRMNPADVVFAQSTDRALVIVDRHEYFDSFGVFHYVNMCWERRLTGKTNPQGRPEGSLQACEKHNEIDSR